MYSFLKLQEGSNEVRIISKPYQYFCHPTLLPKGSQPHEQKLKCAALRGEDSSICPLCKDGDRSRPRWIVPLISRRDKQIYLFDFDLYTFSQLRDFARSKMWGDPENYDVDLCNEVGYNRKYVVALPRMPLTQQEALIKNQLQLTELNYLVTPSRLMANYEDLNRILNREYREYEEYDTVLEKDYC
jgi:hypothetical protein